MNDVDMYALELARADAPFAYKAAAADTPTHDVTSDFLAQQRANLAEDHATRVAGILHRARTAAEQAEQAAAADLAYLSNDPALYLNTEELARAVALSHLFTLDVVNANPLSLICALNGAIARADAAELVALTRVVNYHITQLIVTSPGRHIDVGELREVLRAARVAALPPKVAEQRKAAEARQAQAARLRQWVGEQQAKYTT